MTDQLFDPNDYPSRVDGPGGTRKRTARTITRPARLEPIEPGWSIITTNRGVALYQHAIKAPLTHGSVLTWCGIVGRSLPVDHRHVSERCATCEDMAS